MSLAKLILTMCFVAVASSCSEVEETENITSLYISGGTTSAVYAYDDAETDNGNVGAERIFTGISTQFDTNYSLTHDAYSDTLFVASYTTATVAIFDKAGTLNGNVTPTRSLTGLDTLLGSSISDLALDTVNDELYVAGSHGITIYEKASELDGNIAPVRHITNVVGANLRISLDATDDRLYVTDNTSILIFDNASTLDGTPVADRTISGANTSINFAWGLAIDTSRDLLYVGDQANAAVLVYDNAATVDGNIAPVRTVSGSDTKLVGPSDLFIDQDKNTLYVADGAGTQVLIWKDASTINNNVAPSRSISGLNTGFGNIADLTVANWTKITIRRCPNFDVWFNDCD